MPSIEVLQASRFTHTHTHTHIIFTYNIILEEHDLKRFKEDKGVERSSRIYFFFDPVEFSMEQRWGKEFLNRSAQKYDRRFIENLTLAILIKREIKGRREEKKKQK